MKSTRKYIIAVCSLALGLLVPATFLRAEDSPPPKKEHAPKGERGEMMKEKLGLSDAQAEQIKKIHQEARAQMEKIKDNESLSKDEKMAARKKIQEETKAKVDAVLTPEQRAKAEEMRKKAEEMRKEHKEDGPNGPKDGKDGHKKPKGDE